MTTKPTVYYAHAKNIYHTAEEKKQLEHINRKFPDHIILNPRDHQDYPQDDVMGYYKKLVGSCDRVVFSRLAGKITAGVGVEANHALSLGIQVHELKADKFQPINRKVKYISIEDTVILFDKLSRV